MFSITYTHIIEYICFTCFTHTTGVGSVSMHARLCVMFLFVFLWGYLWKITQKKLKTKTIFLGAHRGLTTPLPHLAYECVILITHNR